jgi:hypothetical protein
MGVQRIADNAEANDWAVLQVDIKNAFNSLDRTTMLQGAKEKVPAVYNWLAWCYGQPSPLYCQGKALAASTTGVHQGDTMGPLGFTLGLDIALDQCLDEERALPWGVWYLDDGTLVGKPEALFNYLQKLTPALRSIGLEINLAKCSLWGPGIQKEDDLHDCIPDTVPLDHPIREVPIVPYGKSAGISVLGIPCDATNHKTHGEKNGSRRLIKLKSYSGGCDSCLTARFGIVCCVTVLTLAKSTT